MSTSLAEDGNGRRLAPFPTTRSGTDLLQYSSERTGRTYKLKKRLMKAAADGNADECWTCLKRKLKNKKQRMIAVHWTDDADLSTAMHKACASGSRSTVKVIKRCGGTFVGKTLVTGDTPLHVAAKQENLKLLHWLLRKYPCEVLEMWDEKNDAGNTVGHLVESCISRQQELCKITEGMESREHLMWKSRLQMEMSDEEEAFEGASWHPDEYETKYEYAQRIWNDMKRKQKIKQMFETEEMGKEIPSAEDAGQHTRHESTEMENGWDHAMAEQSDSAKKAIYEASWEFFCTKPQLNGSVGFQDVPWIVQDQDLDADSLVGVLFCDAESTREKKKIIHRELIRWHPDKFLSRFKEYLKEEDSERIAKRVLATSHALTHALASVYN